MGLIPLALILPEPSHSQGGVSGVHIGRSSKENQAPDKESHPIHQTQELPGSALREAHANKLTKELGWWIRIAAFVGIGFAWLFVGWAIKNERGVWWLIGLMTLLAMCVIVLVKTRRFKLRKSHVAEDYSEWGDADKRKSPARRGAGVKEARVGLSRLLGSISAA